MAVKKRQAHFLRSLQGCFTINGDRRFFSLSKNESEWNYLYCILSVAVVISKCENTFFRDKFDVLCMHKELKGARYSVLLYCSFAYTQE